MEMSNNEEPRSKEIRFELDYSNKIIGGIVMGAGIGAAASLITLIISFAISHPTVGLFLLGCGIVGGFYGWRTDKS